MIKKIETKKEKTLTAEETFKVSGGAACSLGCGCGNDGNCGSQAVSNYTFDQSLSNTLGVDPKPK